MRRHGHTPTLYPHPERTEDGDDDRGPGHHGRHSRHLAESRHRLQQQHKPVVQHWDSHSTSSYGGTNRNSQRYAQQGRPTNSSQARYDNAPKRINQADIYYQFVQRYRSTQQEIDDPRNDPDSYIYQQGLAQLKDADDLSDDDEEYRSRHDEFDHKAPEPLNRSQKDRLEWGIMLDSVLSGEVFKSERARLQDVLERMQQEKDAIRSDIWLGIRAKLHGRTIEEEREHLSKRRIRHVDSVIDALLLFKVTDDAAIGEHHPTTLALQQVAGILRRLEAVQTLYPSFMAFIKAKPRAKSPEFQIRCNTLNTWSTVVTSLRQQIAVLKRWTGSETLDITTPINGPVDASRVSMPSYSSQQENTDGLSFVERILKEETMQRTFEKGFLGTVYSFIGAARDAQVNMGKSFRELNLPSFEMELVPLISFPTRLAQASLRVRLTNVQKLRDPDVLIIDQMTDDLKLSIGLACTLKRQYEAFLTADPGGHWSLPSCISEDYDTTILEALAEFFKLIHWKLKSSSKGIYFKETDILEAQWATFNDVSLTAADGSKLVSEQLWSVTKVIRCFAN